MTPTPEEIKEVLARAAELGRLYGYSTGSQTVTIDAGGASTWASARISTLCCTFMLGLSIGLSSLAVVTWVKVGNVEASTNANKAYLGAIFQKLPELKAEIDKESKK